jgi:integrase
MQGTVIKRGAGYTVVVELERGPDGQRRRAWHSGFRTKREAEAARVRLLADQQRGVYVEPRVVTIASYLEQRWLPAIRTTVRQTTWEGYAHAVRYHFVPRLGAAPLQRLGPDQINAAYADMLAAGQAPATVRKLHTIFHRALRDAHRWGLVARNAADLADPPRKPTAATPRAWGPEQLARFLRGSREDRLWPLWHVIANTGLRRAEAIGARWDDLDLDGGVWRVRRQLVCTKAGAVEADPKTPRARRAVTLDAGTVNVLRDWRRRQLEERLASGSDWRGTGRVFARAHGADLYPGSVTQAFIRRARELGLPDIGIHGLRHTHASLALAAGIPAKVVQERLGHSSVAMTLDVYSHVAPGIQEDAAERIARLVQLD